MKAKKSVRQPTFIKLLFLHGFVVLYKDLSVISLYKQFISISSRRELTMRCVHCENHIEKYLDQKGIAS